MPLIIIPNANPEAAYKMEDEKLDEINEEKNLGVIIRRSLKVGKQCAKAACRGNQFLRLIKRTFISKKKSVILNLYQSLVRPHLEYCIQAWRPHLVKEKVQKRATRLIDECRENSYNERLKFQGLTTQET
jgi:ribonucleases P/MRP protein subunit RPP40